MISVSVPSLVWAVPVVLANALGMGWAVFSVIDAGLQRLEFRLQKRLERNRDDGTAAVHVPMRDS